MPVAAFLSICLAVENQFDTIAEMRNSGITEFQARHYVEETIKKKELRIRSFGIINLVYALPTGSDLWILKQQIKLTCHKRESYRGQYPSERSRR